MWKAAKIALFLLVSGCTAITRLGGGSADTNTEDEGKKLLATASGKLEEAKALGVPTTSEKWEEAAVAWRNAENSADIGLGRCAENNEAHLPYCDDYKQVRAAAMTGYAKFLKDSSASSKVRFNWMQASLFDAENSEAFTDKIDAAKLITQLGDKKRAHFADALASAGDMRGYVKRNTGGICVVGTEPFAPNITDLSAVEYVVGEASATLHLGCITENERSAYKRDQPDRIVFSYWWHGRFEHLHTMPIEDSTGDEISVSVPAEALISAMEKIKRDSPSKFKWPGEWLWVEAEYIVSRIDGRELVAEQDKMVERDVWKNDDIARGTFYFRYVRP